ncbi:MAG: M23 family metallopeptidase [Paracoccaceae bacterium]|nr:M23 family metallopeptidase [Paracoccaceae bacterium]
MIRHTTLLLLAFGLAAPVPVFADPPTSHVLSQSTATIASGDTLDSVLGRAGISPNVRAEAALALAGVYDLTELRPGHRLEWAADQTDPTRLLRLSLFVDDGVEINLSFNGPITAERLDPPIREVDRRETLTLQGPLFEALVGAKAPERFAVDLTALLAGQVDFRRDIKGGESFALVWREDQLPDGSIAGEPRLNYARLELTDRVLELVASDAAGPVIVFEDGEAVQRSAAPILGARLSSVFGRRNHPVLGGVRMHTGIDYAAPVGTKVSATGAGRIIFAGTIRGYGLTVDIDHGGGVVTRYAHLSEIADTVEQGTRVKAGNRIGAVGATGLVSGPNLHYEVRVDGRPIDPTDREVLSAQEIASVDDLNALTTWRKETGFKSAKMEDRG